MCTRSFVFFFLLLYPSFVDTSRFLLPDDKLRPSPLLSLFLSSFSISFARTLLRALIRRSTHTCTQEFRTRLPLFSAAGSFNERERRIPINPPAEKRRAAGCPFFFFLFPSRVNFSHRVEKHSRRRFLGRRLACNFSRDTRSYIPYPREKMITYEYASSLPPSLPSFPRSRS